MKPVQEDNKFFVARRKHIYWEYAFWANVFWTLPAILYISADISFFVAPSNSTVGGYLRFVAAIATAIDWYDM
jgi:hypothetical protein